MARTLKTAHEIRADIQAVIKGAQLGDGCHELCVPEPTRLDEPDATGCNWALVREPWCSAPCWQLVEGLIAREKQICNLK
ncbi:MAG: hypothetical protein HY017_09365 [Betaproteobacteria bacterium]|nr:hypothetical protein [Betaproteobacteria bacterium]